VGSRPGSSRDDRTYGAERCPPIIAALPPELQQRISFSPVTSALHFDQAMSRGVLYDLVFIDGNHEFEFARFGRSRQ
jgi:hypothetical protein